ncbi:MAG: Tim44/TimA family putative adaptor protein [Alphaproteobacteria bacterium]
MTSFFDTILLLFIVFYVFGKLKNVLGTRPDGAEINVDLAKKQTKELLETIVAKEAKQVDAKDDEFAAIPNFNKESFVVAAKRVFEIVLDSYANDKPESLKPLVTKALFEKFEKAIDEKHSKKESSFAELISFKNANIVDLKMLKASAKIAVEFETEQMNITKDADGNVINGDEKFIQTIKDVWTFEKSLSSKSPVWLLCSTKKS